MKIHEYIIVAIAAYLFVWGLLYGLDRQAEVDRLMASKFLQPMGCMTDTECGCIDDCTKPAEVTK